MIVGACIGVPVNLMRLGFRCFPWIAIPFTVTAIIVLHPVMDKDLPTLIGTDMLASPRTYIGVVLMIVGFMGIYFTRCH
jgi:hypothetical protein